MSEMSRVDAGSESWKLQGKIRAAQGQAEIGQIRVVPRQACFALKRNGQRQVKVRVNCRAGSGQ